MADPVRKDDRHYTYQDYKEWPDEERWELIDGVAWNMSPAPTLGHQRILSNLHIAFHAATDHGPCETFFAPFDVFLFASTDQEADHADTVVQPDLSVICDERKLVNRGCNGAPDIVLEVLSTYTMRKDITVKLELYQRAGVREYWVVDAGNKSIMLYRLGDDAKYPEDAEIYQHSGRVVSAVVDGLSVDVVELFGSD